MTFLEQIAVHQQRRENHSEFVSGPREGTINYSETTSHEQWEITVLEMERWQWERLCAQNISHITMENITWVRAVFSLLYVSCLWDSWFRWDIPGGCGWVAHVSSCHQKADTKQPFLRNHWPFLVCDFRKLKSWNLSEKTSLGKGENIYSIYKSHQFCWGLPSARFRGGGMILTPKTNSASHFYHHGFHPSSWKDNISLHASLAGVSRGPWMDLTHR